MIEVAENTKCFVEKQHSRKTGCIETGTFFLQVQNKRPGINQRGAQIEKEQAFSR